ncbi:MAG: HpcH/HpaI aldolase/citrate lyase family protein [Marinobacter sp.]|nr:HpcH/HpaI aldolase/citrate lyase family protein [Marinobacter sp.]
MTAYEGPLGWFLSMAASILIPAGIPVSAPVFDIIEDTETLRREVERDVQMGFVSKTAIHPAQVPIIEGAFSVSEEDLRAARAILDRDASAVFPNWWRYVRACNSCRLGTPHIGAGGSVRVSLVWAGQL